MEGDEGAMEPRGMMMGGVGDGILSIATSVHYNQPCE